MPKILAAAAKILAELALFIGALWKFCFAKNYYGGPTALPTLTLGVTALALVLTIKDEALRLRRERKEREKNRIGPEL